MEPRGHRQIGTIWFYLALTVFLSAAAFLLMLALLPNVSIEAIRRAALPTAFVVLLAGLAAMRGWWHDREAAEKLAGAEDTARAEFDQERQRYQQEIQERERQVDQERQGRLRQ